MSRHHPIGICRGCGNRRHLVGRRLCGICWGQHNRAGRLDIFPRSTRAAREVVEEWVALGGTRATLQQVARAMGMKPATLARALLRARHRGDRRAGPPVAGCEDCRTGTPHGMVGSRTPAREDAQ